MKAQKIKHPWDGFSAHGFTHSEDVDDSNVRGSCCFCGKETKFYINTVTTLWDCKWCSKSGNWTSFLSQIHERNLSDFDVDSSPLRDWLKSKGLDSSAAIACGVGLDVEGGQITIGSYSPQSRICDVRRYTGSKWFASPNGKKGLINGDKIDRSDDSQIVNIVEGESDLVALYSILIGTGRAGNETVVALPGVSSFDKEWPSLLLGKEVRLWFDADKPGFTARDKWIERVSGTVGILKTVNWGDVKDGYDLRDFLKERAGEPDDELYASLQEMSGIHKPDRAAVAPSSGGAIPPGTSAQDWVLNPTPLDPDQMLEVYRKWIHLPDEGILRALFGCMWANKIESRDPVWMGLIGPPSDGKSTLIMSLAGIASTHPMTQATSASLIPGTGTPGVIQRAAGGCVLLKDGTALFSQDKRVQQEVMGIFRDAYDGRVTKTFGGNIGEVRVVSHFGFIMGTTRDFERHRDTAVGERLILYRMAEIDQKERRARVDMVLNSLQGNTGSGQELALRQAASGFMAWERSVKPPVLSPKWSDHLYNLAEFVASARAMVIRDELRRENVYAKREKELPTRLVRQFAKMAIGCAWAWGKKEVDEQDMEIVTKMAWDTPPERDSAMLEALYGGVSVSDVSDITGYPEAICLERIQDFIMLNLVEKKKGNNGRAGRLYGLNPIFEDIFVDSFPEK